MTVPLETRRYTIAEYLALEEKAVERHEFHDGEILAMSGGTYRHSCVVSNLNRFVGNRLDGHGCRPLDSNMRVRIPLMRKYLYPDVTIVCGSPQFDVDDPNQTTIVNPRVVIEVLSDSTERYDRGEKFNLYRQILSLEEYVLISQEQPLVETFLRQAENAWLLTPQKGIQSSLLLRSLKISVPLAEVYTGVEFPPPPRRRGWILVPRRPAEMRIVLPAYGMIVGDYRLEGEKARTSGIALRRVIRH